MIRFWSILIWVMAHLLVLPVANAQTTFADLADTHGQSSLDWRNPDFAFGFNLPPNPGPASLIIKAKPGETAPVPGTYFLLSINQKPAIPFSPVITQFSARFDIPAQSLRAGRNRVEVSFVTTGKRACLGQQDGGWQLNLEQSRFDLALGRPKPVLAELENWLAADIGSPQKIAIRQGNLPDAHFAQFGALLVQALGLRMNSLPEIIADETQADLIITAKITKREAAPFLLRTGKSAPEFILLGADAALVLDAASWFAENKIPVLPENTPLAQWADNSLRRPEPWQQLADNLDRQAWSPLSQQIAVRLPKTATAQLRIEIDRPNQAERNSSLQVFVDDQQIAAPNLWRRVNSLRIILPASQSSARNIALVAQLQPRKPKNQQQSICPDNNWSKRSGSTQVQMQFSGLDRLSDLDHLAWNGGVFTKNHGRDVQVLLPAFTGSDATASLVQSWRALALIARIGGQALSQASYGGNLQADKHVLALGKRDALPPALVRALPNSFAKDKGRAPGDPYPVYQRPRLTESAFADALSLPAFGIAATARRPNGRVWLAFSAETNAELASALQDFANGTALDHFAGTVVRWRGNKVEVNATRGRMSLPAPYKSLPVWLLYMLILVPTGIWSIMVLSMQKRMIKFTQS